MKSYIFSIVFAIGFAFSGLCDVIHVRNTTAETILAHVYFNNGTGCIPLDDIVVCVPPFDGVNIDVPGLVPYTIRVFESCPIPDWTTESWRHNDTDEIDPGCTDAPLFSETPYIIEWSFDEDDVDPIIDWGAVISL